MSNGTTLAKFALSMQTDQGPKGPPGAVADCLAAALYICTLMGLSESDIQGWVKTAVIEWFKIGPGGKMPKQHVH